MNLISCNQCNWQYVARKCQCHQSLFDQGHDVHNGQNVHMMQGIEPWNNGRAMRPETCLKMSAAKQGRTLPKAVCTKISQTRTGQLHSEVMLNT